MNFRFGFSLIELSVSLLVIAVIIACLMPVISKRLTSASTVKNRISTSCESVYPDGYCAMCYLTPKSCVVCTRNCSVGEYKNVSKCECEKCSVKYGDLNCTRCNSQRCTQCKEGYYLDNNGRCSICPLGYYCYQDGEYSVKKPCAKGYVAPNQGMSSCVSCLKSTASNSGSVSVVEAGVNCTLCGNGYYASKEAQGSVCEICPKGYYCPNGKYIPCQRGYFNNQQGKSACSACAKSDSNVTGSIAIAEGSINCSSCTDGNYSSVQAQASNCNLCPWGYYCPNGRLIQCPIGTYSTGASASCTPCPSGTTSNVGAGSCASCSNGCSSCSGSISNCTKCKAGFYKIGSSCAQCASGYFSYANSVSCTQCSTKYPHCKACNESRCVECEEGFKLSDDGQRCEQNCPAKTILVETGGKKLCVMQYNMGDATEFPLVGISTVVDTSSSSHVYRPNCYRGTTAGACNNYNGGYSGCNRTLCSASAAKTLCANLNYGGYITWRLPSPSEISAFAAYSVNKGSSGLMLCDREAGYGSAQCADKNKSCHYGDYNTTCIPSFIWTNQSQQVKQQGRYVTITKWGYLYKGETRQHNSGNENILSVRCVVEIK